MTTNIPILPVRLPGDIIRELPHGTYPEHFQPQYDDVALLQTAVGVLQTLPGVTTPTHGAELRHALAVISEGRDKRCIVIEGPCAESVSAATTVRELAADAAARSRALDQSRLGGHMLHIQRRVQSVKPRSSATESIGGRIVPSHMGDAVNSEHTAGRTPDPHRLVAMATQALALEATLTEQYGRHIYTAHEALSLPFEQAMLRYDVAAKRTYIVSADLPWIGARTNSADGAHVALLAGIANAVGVKISDDSTPALIQALVARLDPRHEPGRLVFMLRLTPANSTGLGAILQAIKQHAPGSLVLYDIHGVTVQAGGRKLRRVEDIIAQIRQVHAAALHAGLRLHGVHLETMGDDSQLECLDDASQTPTRPGSVDPALNPRQLRTVLDAVADCLQEWA